MKRKRISDILGVLCVAAVLTACILTDEAGEPCLWNYFLFAFAGLTGWASKKMEGAR